MLSTNQMRTRRLYAALGASALLAALTACGAENDDHAASQQRPTQSAEAAAKDPAVFATVELHADQSFIAPFAQPSLQRFLLDPYVGNIVIGTVESSRSQVGATEGGHDVFTTSQIAVESSAVPTAKVITLSTLGGTVPLRDVRSDFEGRPEQAKLTDADLDKLVTYEVNGAAQPRAGERVMVVLSKDGGTLLDMVLEGDRYGWRGNEAPNPAWAASLSAREALEMVAALKQARG